MKKILLAGVTAACLSLSAYSNDNSSSVHTHEDGSTHTDHAQDTPRPVQQEFTVADSAQVDTATSGAHSHAGGEPHAH